MQTREVMHPNSVVFRLHLEAHRVQRLNGKIGYTIESGRRRSGGSQSLGREVRSETEEEQVWKEGEVDRWLVVLWMEQARQGAKGRNYGVVGYSLIDVTRSSLSEMGMMGPPRDQEECYWEGRQGSELTFELHSADSCQAEQSLRSLQNVNGKLETFANASAKPLG
ncbi:hypothetical protein K438DRAFT_1760294 [Mycena galopus ATCC 62051]|nr:hypothetical protein K438DRAFT_1760294 [Mycena galopus ATCC 62051]